VSGHSEEGSAPIEFLGFGIPLIFLVLISSQLLVTSYLSNIALDAANEGAQALAYSDGSTQAARDKVGKVFAWLTPNSKWEMDSISDSRGTISFAQVTVRLSNPYSLFSGGIISESASVIDETN
jgi:hypothetical protein